MVFWAIENRQKIEKKNAFAKFNRALSNLCKGSYVIDCGANVGEFTKLFLEKGFIVDAFEPDPIAINELKKKCKNNKNLNLFQSAVGLKDNTQKLFRYRKFDENDPYSTQGSSLLDYRSGTNKPFVEIKVIDFINHINKQKKEISLLKMDIEGSEIEILNKIIDLNMHDKIKYIFVETHERFSHKLGLETAKLKLRIKNLNINNINLDWV